MPISLCVLKAPLFGHRWEACGESARLIRKALKFVNQEINVRHEKNEWHSRACGGRPLLLRLIRRAFQPSPVWPWCVFEVSAPWPFFCFFFVDFRKTKAYKGRTRHGNGSHAGNNGKAVGDETMTNGTKDANGNINCINCDGCFNCINCINCTDCKECYYCEDCIGCDHCESCTKCKECTRCTNCFCCDDCGGCDDCMKCTNCFCCTNCDECNKSSFCYDCGGCDDCTYCENCTGCNKCERCYECTNCECVAGGDRYDRMRLVRTVC